MQIQINTDGNIEGTEALAGQIKDVLKGTLSRYSDRITRIEVHLSDQNGAKSGQDDKRCVLEARLEGRQPTAVTHQAATVEEAVEGAAEKLLRSLQTTLGRLKDAGRS
jgi:hypothetical protein